MEKKSFLHQCSMWSIQRFRQIIFVAAVIFFFAGCVTASEPGYAASMTPVITIHAKRFAFLPSQITLKAGETVRLVFVSDDVNHSISVPEAGIDLQIWRHRTNQIVITPTKIGDFSGECARYCGVGHDKMTFTVHVVR